MASSRLTTASAISKGNRVLRLFAQALKDSCREYDYVARMGGDEFVVVAPGLAADAAGKKAEQMRALAKQAGTEVCGEEILSLSVGRAVYPEDGKDAEQLLAEADRRMYLEKQKQLAYKDRRSHPRMKCRVTIELQTETGGTPLFANLTDVSLGGCFVETSTILSPGSENQVRVLDGRLHLVGGRSGGATRSRFRRCGAVPRDEPRRHASGCSGFSSSCRRRPRSTTTGIWIA